MSFTVAASFSFGVSRVGLNDLRVQPKTAAGTATGGTISTGFTEQGKGVYLWSGSVPDDATFLTAYSVGTAGLLSVRGAVSAAASGVWSTAQRDLMLRQANKITTATNVWRDPVGREGTRIVRGDDYAAADNRALFYPMPEGANWPTDLTGWTVTWVATKTSRNLADGAASLTANTTVTQATGDDRAVQVELTHEQTSTLAVGVWSEGYDLVIRATKEGRYATLWESQLAVDAG